ncbi:hypothetical protein [Spiroplasma endosymbiont of Othius punctulatus]|uniref:hypothetical protein n=1 Tax=Spiroplasma endosymbiont of Othius punctulatus TaxID=3066289 RepID=UPI0030D286BB
MKLIGKIFSSVGPIATLIFVLILLFGVGVGYNSFLGDIKLTFGDLTSPMTSVGKYMIVMLTFALVAALSFIPLWFVKWSKMLTIIVNAGIVFSSFIIGIMSICVLADSTNDIITPDLLTLAMWWILGIILPIGAAIVSEVFGFVGILKAK